MIPTSFTDLYADAARRREAGDTEGAVALLRDNLKTFPLHRGVVYLALAELLADEGRPKDAIEILSQAFTAGCRFKATQLREDPHLAPLATDARFGRVVARLAERYETDAAAARPDLLIRAPAGEPGPDGRPLLVALHGNNSNARETARHWSSAVSAGWVLAVPQSSEIGSSPDAYLWNDRARATREIDAHLTRAGELHRIDRRRTVLAGFSMGGLQAVALALAHGVAACGVLPVAPWLPDISELAALAGSGAARLVPMYIVVGDQDPSLDGATQLATLLESRGAKATLDVRAGMSHQYPADMDATLGRALPFLAG
ncbi:MAG TPA: alpha/beta fold hydrolase [Candidatus Limnocylindria bacterium]|nr:alpha/beta fold hydrolase [Candidatus Limnocylindria bacterium]